VVDGVQSKVVWSVGVGNDIRVGGCYGESSCRGLFHGHMTTHALGKCDLIIALR
jgi:hypothetical protein